MMIGVLLLVLTPLIYYAITTSSETIRENKANDAVKTIANVADTVYTLGPGSKRYVDVDLPGGITDVCIGDQNLDVTYNCGAGGEKTINLNITIYKGSSNIFAESKANLTVGSRGFPTQEGKFTIEVMMLEIGDPNSGKVQIQKAF